jgi:hypothetical protein
MHEMAGEAALLVAPETCLEGINDGELAPSWCDNALSFGLQNLQAGVSLARLTVFTCSTRQRMFDADERISSWRPPDGGNECASNDMPHIWPWEEVVLLFDYCGLLLDLQSFFFFNFLFRARCHVHSTEPLAFGVVQAQPLHINGPWMIMEGSKLCTSIGVQVQESDLLHHT